MSDTNQSISKCIYCGNNPTNHLAEYLSESSMVVAMPLCRLIDFFMMPPLYSLIHNTLLTWTLDLFKFANLIRYSDDITKACSQRSGVIWEEAAKRGIKMQQVIVADRPVEQYRAYINGRWCHFTSIPIPLFADRRAYVWMDSKAYVKKHFLEHGVHVPNGGTALTLGGAEEIFNTVQKPVIVKPESGTRGRHSLTNLNTLEDLRHGFKIAQQLCCSVVVEEHLVGSVYRATYVGGEIAGILRGDPPRITGDGILTIASLIEKKNREKPERVKDVVVTKAITEFLAKQTYNTESILPEGKTIDLVEKVGLSYGGDAREEYEITHPKLLAELKKAGDVLGAPIVGFDFISEDITKDPDTVRWGIIEANSMPFIDLHHFPRVGTPRNVAAKVWDLWDEKR